jgi:hypothetical protein
MGSKIPAAMLYSGQTVTALSYEAEPGGEIFCTSNECQAELSFVRRHNRKYQSKTIEIAPCFRLKKHHVHHLACKYNIEGRLDLIAKSSDSDVFQSLEKSKYEFRLHVLLKALRVLDEYRVIELARKWGGSFDQNKSYSNKGKLTSYLRTLGQILELKSYCEDDEELASRIILDYRGSKIKWQKFHYDEKNLPMLVQDHGTGELDTPLAISGHVYSVKNLPSGKCVVVELYSPVLVHDPSKRAWKATPQVYMHGEKLQSVIQKGAEYIFFGRWEVSLKTYSKSGEKNRINYQNIKMNISSSDHFIEI